MKKRKEILFEFYQNLFVFSFVARLDKDIIKLWEKGPETKEI